MIIRRAMAGDIDDISALLSQVLEIHHNGRPDIFKGNAVKYLPGELAEILKDESRPVFVAEIEGKVVGYAFCVIEKHINNNILTDIKTLYIDDLCVDKECRGKHIGQSLYTHVLEYAKEIGCYNITLNVWELNDGAKKFYDKCGFFAQKTVMEKIL